MRWCCGRYFAGPGHETQRRRYRAAARERLQPIEYADDDSSRDNQNGQEHPILNLKAKNGKFLNEDMHRDSWQRNGPSVSRRKLRPFRKVPGEHYPTQFCCGFASRQYPLKYALEGRLSCSPNATPPGCPR